MNKIKENKTYCYTEILPEDFVKTDLVNLESVKG